MAHVWKKVKTGSTPTNWPIDVTIAPWVKEARLRQAEPVADVAQIGRWTRIPNGGPESYNCIKKSKSKN